MRVFVLGVISYAYILCCQQETDLMASYSDSLAVPAVICDVLFLEASTTNLLIGLSLVERFDGIRIKILETTQRPFSSPASLTTISPDAWRNLTELAPSLARAVYREGLFVKDDALDERHRLRDTQMISSKGFYEMLLASLPSAVFASASPPTRIQETADLVTLEMENGDVYETKLLIRGGLEHGLQSDFVEITCTATNCQSGANTRWSSEDMYISHDTLGTGLHVFGCLLPYQEASLERLLMKLDSIPELREVLTGSHVESFWSRPLHRSPISASHGRIASSGELSTGIPYFSRFKAETEFEEALLLKRAILQKGLTAAAVSDWKRRYTASTRTRFLKDLKSPVELFSISEDSLNNGHRYGPRESSSSHEHMDLGKPLVCSTVRPYMALSLVD